MSLLLLFRHRGSISGAGGAFGGGAVGARGRYPYSHKKYKKYYIPRVGYVPEKIAKVSSEKSTSKDFLSIPLKSTSERQQKYLILSLDEVLSLQHGKDELSRMIADLGVIVAKLNRDALAKRLANMTTNLEQRLKEARREKERLEAAKSLLENRIQYLLEEEEDDELLLQAFGFLLTKVH